MRRRHRQSHKEKRRRSKGMGNGGLGRVGKFHHCVLGAANETLKEQTATGLRGVLVTEPLTASPMENGQCNTSSRRRKTRDGGWYSSWWWQWR